MYYAWLLGGGIESFYNLNDDFKYYDVNAL